MGLLARTPLVRRGASITLTNPVLQSIRSCFGWRSDVTVSRASIKASVAFAVASMIVFATSSFAQSPGADPNPPAQSTAVAAPPPNTDRYRDGIVIWETPPDAQ